MCKKALALFVQMMTANSLAICLVKMGKTEAALSFLTSYLANHPVGEFTQGTVAAIFYLLYVLHCLKFSTIIKYYGEQYCSLKNTKVGTGRFGPSCSHLCIL